jgi:hypothetical protein
MWIFLAGVGSSWAEADGMPLPYKGEDTKMDGKTDRNSKLKNIPWYNPSFDTKQGLDEREKSMPLNKRKDIMSLNDVRYVLEDLQNGLISLENQVVEYLQDGGERALGKKERTEQTWDALRFSIEDQLPRMAAYFLNLPVEVRQLLGTWLRYLGRVVEDKDVVVVSNRDIAEVLENIGYSIEAGSFPEFKRY